MKSNPTNLWRRFEAGRVYKQSIGLYEAVRRNERFYRGDQWSSSASNDLPKPVFNVVKRIIDYLVNTVGANNYTITYNDENIPFAEKNRDVIKSSLSLITKNGKYRWERCKMDSVLYDMLLDAAISGDGVAYCYWDTDINGGNGYKGDISIGVVDNVNLFVSDMNEPDIQSQEYVMISGRDSVTRLRKEAIAQGVPSKEAEKIVADKDYIQGSDYSQIELDDGGAGKATYVLCFHKEDGKVVFEKFTENCLIKRCVTDCTLYPVAYFSWTPTKNCFHGTSPITSMIPNQNFINRAYAMVMKHMTDTAFSKIIYDKSRIPEWSNEVGEAIGVVGGSNVSDAVSVIGTGKMQEGYLELIDNAMTTTKELMGATETALGNTNPTNTSAIIAVRDASKRSLDKVTSSLARCIEDIANIWVDMMCAYYPKDRLLPYVDDDGEKISEKIDFDALKDSLIKAKVEVCESEKNSASMLVSVLDKLLDGGYITAEHYVESLPEGYVINRKSMKFIDDAKGDKVNE